MRVGISTSVIQRGKTGVAQYVFALLRALAPHAQRHQFTLFVLEEDRPLFEFALNFARVVAVSERFRPPVQNILWHQACLPHLARVHQLDVLHVPSYRRMLAPRPCPLVATIHDLAPFHVVAKYDWKRMWYGRVIARRLAWLRTPSSLSARIPRAISPDFSASRPIGSPSSLTAWLTIAFSRATANDPGRRSPLDMTSAAPFFCTWPGSSIPGKITSDSSTPSTNSNARPDRIGSSSSAAAIGTAPKKSTRHSKRRLRAGCAHPRIRPRRGAA